MDNATIQAIKAAMEYRDGKQRCGTCQFFVPTDCSGNHNAKMSHCTLSPAFDVEVVEAGYCKHFSAKTSK